jgi:ataxin-10
MYGKAVNAESLGPHHPDPTGFVNLKRDLVRLLGILVYEDKTIQDRIRLCDGIPVIMNLCVLDERNPCKSQKTLLAPISSSPLLVLREYALFALRNTLQGNIENQKTVDAIQPSGYWDNDGVLRDIAGATRK